MMKFRTGILILLVSLFIMFGSRAKAGENLTPTPADVALLTGLRADTSENPAGLIALRVGPIFMHRQDNRSLILAEYSVTGEDVMNASDLDLKFAVGYDFTLEAQFGVFGAEARYFGIPEWSRHSGTALNGTRVGIQYRTPIYSFPAGVSASYDSQLHSIELSFKWYPMARLAVLAGPRYFQLDEELIINSCLPNGTIWLECNHETTNTLIGGQVGVEGVFFTVGGFSADGWLKACYYRNDMSSNMKYLIFGHPTGFYANGDAEKGTFVGDLASTSTTRSRPGSL
jgi:hypothetical protein